MRKTSPATSVMLYPHYLPLLMAPKGDLQVSQLSANPPSFNPASGHVTLPLPLKFTQPRTAAVQG